MWIWRSGAIEPHVLRGDHYEAIDASEVLPGLDLGLLSGFVDDRPTSVAMREYRAALR